MPIAVIGIGQSMRGDDAAGLEAVRLWQRRHTQTAGSPDVRVAIIESPGLELLDLLDGMDAAILVDAICSDAPPGSLQRIRPGDLTESRFNSGSGHSWGVAEALRLSSALDPRSGRRDIRLLGIQAGSLNVGEGLSESVRGALPAVCEAIQNEVLSLLWS
jgi:hydrogenase maturation protease